MDSNNSVGAVKKERPKLPQGFYRTTFLIGLGFFTMGLMDPLYDSFVPQFLRDLFERLNIHSMGLVGSVMTIDNILALILIPIVTAISDRVRTPIGRRMPFILVTLPMSALFFALIPFGWMKGLFLFMIIIFMLNVFKQSARGPVVALMPDTVPADYRSEANGVINTMGGIAAIVGTLFLAKLFDINPNFPFALSAGLAVLATLALFLFVKEKKGGGNDETTGNSGEKNPSLLVSFGNILGAKDKSAVLILFAIFFWFLGYQGVLPFVSIYATDFIKVTKGTAAMSPGFVGVAYALFAVPSGILAHRIGRKNVIRGSLVGLVVVMILLFASLPIAQSMGLSLKTYLFVFWAILFVFGIFWVSVITNSFPMLWQMATWGNVGIYTGIYYTFSQLAAIAAPPVAGLLMDAFGKRAVFLYAAVCFCIAIVFMFAVKRGDVHDKPIAESV